MSGVAGAFYYDRQPPDAALVRALLDAMPGRGSDDVGVALAPRVAAGFRARWTTEEARRERQPLQSADGRVRLVYDGRVDNRDALAEYLRVPGPSTDGALLAELIASRGPDALARCVGEFALAWWTADGASRGLARDSLGMRPLYYAVTPRGVVWASELQALLASGWIARRVNEPFVAEYLTLVPQSIDETPFAGVYRLPQAHVLDVSGDRAERRRYWTCPIVEERRVSPPQAAEEFRAHLSSAVHACLRVTRPPAFQLSGGLDSPSVMATAHALGVAEPAAFSLVFPGVARADESAHIREIAAWSHAVSRAFPPIVPERGPFEYIVAHEDLPYHPGSEPLLRPLVDEAAAAGHDVMLTGLGGDQWLTPSFSHIAALLRRGRLLRAARLVADLRSHYAPNWDWRWVWGAGILPLVPAPIKALARRARGRRDHAPWIPDAFAARTNLDDRLRASFRRAPPVDDPVVRESLVRLTGGEEATVREDAERMGTHAGIELRHPYYDRRLVEFVIGLPEALRFADGRSKPITRAAMRGLLPDAILERPDKADFTAAIFGHVRAAIQTTDWNRLEVVTRGWVESTVADRLRRDFDAPESPGPRRAVACFAIWQIAGLEAWVRRVFP